jgi:G6PDH family F420-dependent oxidoreductase
MPSFGYTVMGEQAGPKQLVRDAIRAEEAGFDFIAASDHYFPCLAEQGHSPYVWSVLGAIAHATERIELMTYVTCPTMRYHPTVVAQKAATVQLLSDGRFMLGIGAGENLNEHIMGRGWPGVDVRHEMLRDALEIIRPLLAGKTVTYRGQHLQAEAARLWDVPPDAPSIGVAVSGPRSCEVAGRYADVMIAVQPSRQLGELFEAAGGTGKRRVGQIAVSFDPDVDAARKRALEQFRWFGGGWKVMAELPGPKNFDAASRFVREEDVARGIPCGPDVDAHVRAVRRFVDAGFTDVALVQVGGAQQDQFIDWATSDLLPALREATNSG